MLISEKYREQNKQLHSTGHYGISGYKLMHEVGRLCEELGTKDVLDYGCGQRTLEGALGFPIQNYDPAIEGLEQPPRPAEIVVCGDVLEHIEPECLDAVLDDLKRVTKNIGLYLVDFRPSQKFLPDGRNAHLIQQPADWWFPKLFQRFSTVQVSDVVFQSKTTPGLLKVVGILFVVKGAR